MGKRFQRFKKSQLVIPIFALLLLSLFNAIRDPSFFSLNVIVNNSGNSVLSGNLISILNSASELAILSIGMTLVTASSKGQDISVGAVRCPLRAACLYAYSRSTRSTGRSSCWGFFCACLVAVLCGAFNGALVAIFKIQPMIATLILLTAGRGRLPTGSTAARRRPWKVRS